MNISKRRICYERFFKITIHLSPSCMMYKSRANHSKINRLLERYLRIIFSDKTPSFEALLEKDGYVPIHNRIFSFLLLKCIRQEKTCLRQSWLSCSKKKNEHQSNLRHNSEFAMPVLNSVYYGTESVSFLGPKIWNIVPVRLNRSIVQGLFKTAIKKWKPEKCPCRLSGIYIHYISFI